MKWRALAPLLLLPLLYSPKLLAIACSSPVGTPGEMRFQSSEMQFCDNNGIWQSTTVSTLGTTCSVAGQMVVNGADFQYCNGTNWASMNGTATGGSCSGNGSLSFDSTANAMKWCAASAYNFLQPNASVSWVTNAGNIADQTSYTYSSTSLGTAYSDRYLVIGVAARSASNFIPSTLTVGGTSATLLYQAQTGGSTAGFFMLPYPTGTAADIVVTYSGQMVRAGISVWSVRHLHSASVSASGVLSGIPATFVLSIPAGGVGLSVAYNNTSSTYTWTNLNQDFQSILPDGSGLYLNYTSASLTSTTSQSITVTNSVASQSAFEGVAISLR